MGLCNLSFTGNVEEQADYLANVCVGFAGKDKRFNMNNGNTKKFGRAGQAMAEHSQNVQPICGRHLRILPSN